MARKVLFLGVASVTSHEAFISRNYAHYKCFKTMVENGYLYPEDNWDYVACRLHKGKYYVFAKLAE